MSAEVSGRPAAVQDAIAGMVDDLERAAHLELLSPLLSPGPARTGGNLSGGRRRKHFLVHPVDGQVHWYRPLAEVLGTGWDCYGLQMSPADPASGPPMVQGPRTTTFTPWDCPEHRS